MTRTESPLDTADVGVELPIDSDGLCLFHSHNVPWKRAEGFHDHFERLLPALDEIEYFGPSYDLVQFVFVGSSQDGASPRPSLVVNHQTFLGNVDFSGSLFVDAITFDQCRFRSFNFAHCTFQDKVRFVDVVSTGGYCFFDGSQFQQACTFEKSQFAGLVYFSETRIDGNPNTAKLRFDEVRFDGAVDFSRSVINVPTQFRRVTFLSLGEFTDTEFNPIESTLRLVDSAVSFQEIRLGEKAVLSFRGSSGDNKLFRHDAAFNFTADTEGLVRFENVNFQNILKASRSHLRQLEQAGRVEVGRGCIKYRHQTDIRTLEVDASNQILALELAHTFTNYFINQNGLNLGLEVVERAENKVRFFYFSDENITADEFLARLESTEQDLWDLLSVRFDARRLLTEGTNDTALIAHNENTLIQTVDGISALMGTFFRVGIRIAFGKWSGKDTRALMGAVRFGGESTTLTPGELHHALVERYSGQSLLALNENQHDGLVISHRRSLPAASVNADSKLQIPATPRRILFLGSSPPEVSHLALDLEVRQIKADLRSSKERDQLEFHQAGAVTVQDCMQALLDLSPTIVHFSGHGSTTGIIVEGEEEKLETVTADGLAELFGQFRGSIRCVILNACYSALHAEAIRMMIPCVVGMSTKITDRASIAFSIGFYKAIGAGKNIQFAFELGVVAVKLASPQEAEIPQLFSDET